DVASWKRTTVEISEASAFDGNARISYVSILICVSDTLAISPVKPTRIPDAVTDAPFTTGTSVVYNRNRNVDAPGTSITSCRSDASACTSWASTIQSTASPLGVRQCAVAGMNCVHPPQSTPLASAPIINSGLI